ncbi:hypothetical protein L873DRAFT_1011295 [Choiromyces venosus 120613-1]|uniref:Uncharacterized protein n=1 Tax=Choiromyces venosus 120613-1 TaxID=1336337 RepID=A0A3N4JP74_9PEZI|nr:hypothetical protein L873DRAFT_1011295 [Choiromyces venosus 120613-1]
MWYLNNCGFQEILRYLSTLFSLAIIIPTTNNSQMSAQALQDLTDEFQSLSKDMSTIIQARQKLDSQLQENKSVQKCVLSFPARSMYSAAFARMLSFILGFFSHFRASKKHSSAE